MRIGFLGNTNNYPFMVARALRRRGHEVLFLVDSDDPLHRPEYRYDDIPYPYPDWIVDVSAQMIGKGVQSSARQRLDFAASLILTTYPTARHRRIVRLLRTCDAVVLNAYGIAFQQEVGLPAFVMLVGYDLESLADYRAIDAQFASWRPLHRVPWRLLVRHLVARIVPRQRAGILGAEGFSFFAAGLVPPGDALLAEIGIDPRRREFIMMTEPDRIPMTAPPNGDPLRVFCGTRFNWKSRSGGMNNLDYKGSDIMIRGLAQYVRETGSPLNVRFVAKGADVEASKQLAEEVGLSPHITWLAQMSQMGIAQEIEAADVVVEHLGSTFIGMMGLDSMAAGRPVIAEARPEIFEPLFGEASPICQANTPEGVAAQMRRLADPAERAHVGTRSRAYVEKFFSTDRAAELILRHLER